MGKNLERDLHAAKSSVEHAAEAVNLILSELQQASRAEKIAIGWPLEAALQRLLDARAILSELELERTAESR